MNHLMTDDNRIIVDSIMKGVSIEDLDALLEKEEIEKDHYCWWVEELVCTLSKNKLDVYSDYVDPEFTHGWESPVNDKECAIYAGISYAIQDMYRLRDGIPSAFRIYHDWFDMGVISRNGDDPNATIYPGSPVDAYNTHLCSICNILAQKLLHEDPTLYLFMCEMDMRIDEVIMQIMDLPNEFVYSFSYNEILSYLRHFLMVIKKKSWGEWGGKSPESIRSDFFNKMTYDNEKYLHLLEDRFDIVHLKIANDIGMKFDDVPLDFVFNIIRDGDLTYRNMFHQTDKKWHRPNEEKDFSGMLKEEYPDLYAYSVSKEILKEHIKVRVLFDERGKDEVRFERHVQDVEIIDYMERILLGERMRILIDSLEGKEIQKEGSEKVEPDMEVQDLGK